MFIAGSISEVCWLTIIPPEERVMRQRGNLRVLGHICEFHFEFIFRGLGRLQIYIYCLKRHEVLCAAASRPKKSRIL